MNDIVRRIVELAEASEEKPDFLEAVFGVRLDDVLQGKRVVLFGAGVTGMDVCSALRRRGVEPYAF